MIFFCHNNSRWQTSRFIIDLLNLIFNFTTRELRELLKRLESPALKKIRFCHLCGLFRSVHKPRNQELRKGEQPQERSEAIEKEKPWVIFSIPYCSLFLEHTELVILAKQTETKIANFLTL